MGIQIPSNHLRLLQQIVRKHVDVEKYQPVVFGSRATGSARQYSDIDLGFLGAEPVEDVALLRVIDDLEESSLPYTVDVVDFATVDPEFKKIALKAYEKL